MKRFLLGLSLLALSLPVHAQVVTGGGGADPTPQTGTGAWVRAVAPTFTGKVTINAGQDALNLGSGTYPKITAQQALIVTNNPGSTDFALLNSGTDGGISVLAGASFNWDSATSNISASPDLFLWRDAANTLAQRNGTSAQTYSVYNTYTNSSNYERFTANWSSNVLYLRNQNAGTGSARMMIPVTGATTVAGLPSASTAGIGARAFVTDGSTTVILGLGLTVAGGGANKVPVYSDGTNWIVG